MASLDDEIAAQKAEIAQYTNERGSIVISDQTGDERRLLESMRYQLLAIITAKQNTLNILLAQQSQQQGNNSHSSVPGSTLISTKIHVNHYCKFHLLTYSQHILPFLLQHFSDCISFPLISI
jgi:hypothetical protein